MSSATCLEMSLDNLFNTRLFEKKRILAFFQGKGLAQDQLFHLVTILHQDYLLLMKIPYQLADKELYPIVAIKVTNHGEQNQ